MILLRIIYTDDGTILFKQYYCYYWYSLIKYVPKHNTPLYIYIYICIFFKLKEPKYLHQRNL